MGLLYGTGNATRQEIAMMDEPVKIGSWHHPVPFADFIEMVTEALGEEGIRILEEEYQLTHNDQRMFGAMLITPADDDSFLPGTKTDLILGMRGSHDKIVPRGLTVGTRVTVCSNLCFSGNMGTLQTRQTTNIMKRLPGMIREIIRRIRGLAEQNQLRIDQYKNHNLGTSQMGDALLVEMLRQDVVNLQQFQTAIQEWVEPSFIEHQEEGQYTAWNLFNAVTQSFKPTGAREDNVYNHDALNVRSGKLIQLLDDTTGLDLPKAA